MATTLASLPTERLDERRVTVNGLSIYYRSSVTNTPKTDEAVVLVPGLNVSSRHNVRLAEYLAPHARVFAALTPAYLDPADIASLALFLASDESRHINGAIIPADAGWAAV